MIYTPLTYLAMRIAYDAHHGVLDKNGAPYMFHPYEVAGRMDDEVSASAPGPSFFPNHETWSCIRIHQSD